MAAEGVVLKVVVVLFLVCSFSGGWVAAATWCVARSDASEQSLQTALDYACAAGADCAPIQPSGLCYLPNTVQAHASYAFNSYYQRRANAPGSCSFAGTSTIARTDPSYGSCVYPSSPSTAGGTVSVAPGGTTMPGTLMSPPPPGTTGPLYGSGGGITPGSLGPVIPDSPRPNGSTILWRKTNLRPVIFLLVFLFVFQTM